MSAFSVTTAVPFSWLTSADATSASASSADFTLASQCGHIIPSIFSVFVIWVSSLIFDLFSVFISLSFTKLSLSAFVTTQKLDRLIAAAPNIGFIPQPRTDMNTPAASGMPMML